MIIADATPTATQLGSWIVCFFAVLQGVFTVVLLVTINQKQKREVSFAGEAVDKKDFDRALQENKEVHNQLFAKIGGVERGIEEKISKKIDASEAEARESRRVMHQGLDALGQRVASMETATQGNTAAITRIGDQIIELFRGTK
jgi:hypothetical protein